MPVVVAFDVSEQRPLCLSLCRSSALMDKFHLKGVKKLSIEHYRSRCWCGSLRAPRRSPPGGHIGVSCILRPAIRMADETGRRSLPLARHHHCRERQLGPPMIAHGPTMILRVARSSTAARYSQPSPVAI